MSDPEETRAPLLAHFAEMRNRLMVCVIAWALASVVSYLYAHEIYNFLMQPLMHAFDQPESRRLIYTSLTEAFVTYLKLAMFAGLMFSFPIIATQVYSFLAPGLYKHEKTRMAPYLLLAPLLFLAGAALAYYYIFPYAWKFFVSFESPGGVDALPIQLETKVSDYLSLAMHIIVVFGLAFQMPLILVFLVQIGVLSVESLARARRYVIVIIVVAAGFLTPPDVFSQVALSVPLYILYEIAIFVGRIISRPQREETDHA